MGVITIQERQQKVDTLLEQVKNHCMCLELIPQNDGYLVHYPNGYYPDGVWCAYSIGKANALQKILDHMENTWNANYPQ